LEHHSRPLENQRQNLPSPLGISAPLNPNLAELSTGGGEIDKIRGIKGVLRFFVKFIAQPSPVHLSKSALYTKIQIFLGLQKLSAIQGVSGSKSGESPKNAPPGFAFIYTRLTRARSSGQQGTTRAGDHAKTAAGFA
jgi:hypothetical protein